MAFEKLVLEVSREINQIPKAARLGYLKEKISKLPSGQRQDAEHILGLALISLDHSPELQKTAMQKFTGFFGWTDILSIPLAAMGVLLVSLSSKSSEVEFSLTDMSIKTNNIGYFLIMLGVLIFLSRGIISRAKP